jgi:hypothetical protein
MTVINGIEIDDIDYKVNEIKYAIKNNDPIEDKLHVILVISNPCLYARRYILLKEFVKRIEEEEEDVILYIVEMAYKKQKFIVTEAGNKRHLQLRTEVPLWHKENMINLGVKLLPAGYKAFAWIDADIEFDSVTWAKDTLRLLNGSKDIVQLFSHAVDMYHDERNIHIFNSFGYSFCKKKKYAITGSDFWHPGFAWAMTRKAYERVGIYDRAILGSGDNVIALSLINKVHLQTDEYSQEYKDDMLAYQSKAKSLRIGYVPGIIRHYYHGSKKNRQYGERWKILIKYDYKPSMIRYQDGIIVPVLDARGLDADASFPEEFCDEILKYFSDRNEDES